MPIITSGLQWVIPDDEWLSLAPGADPAPGTPEELARYMRIDHERWKKVISTAAIKPQ